MTPEITTALYAEAMASRMMISQLIAFVANQEADPALFSVNFREAALRSLDYSAGLSGADNSTIAVQINERARTLIENTLDTIGRVSD